MEKYISADSIPAEADSNKTERETSRRIKSYDFKHPKLVSKENMRALKNIHELLSRNLTRIFTEVLNQKVDVPFEDIEEVIFSEYLSSLEPPTGLFLFNIEELGEWAVLEIDPSFSLYVIERQSGSLDIDIKPARGLTRIEERVFSRTVEKVFKELGHVWSPYLKITILNHVYESKPANIRTISSNVPGIVVRYNIILHDRSVPLKLCYPYALLKEQLNNSSHEPQKNEYRQSLSTAQKRTFENYVKTIKVPLQVILGRADITMDELIQLCEGDVLKLDQSIDDPLDILVNGAKKMGAYPGIMNGNKAVKVFEVPKSIK